MYKLTKDEFYVLSKKLNSATFTAIAGGIDSPDEAVGEAGLKQKGILEGDKAYAELKAYADILDNSPDVKVTRMSPGGFEGSMAAAPMGGFAMPGFGGGGGGGVAEPGDAPVIKRQAKESIPYEVLAQKGDKMAAISQTTTKDWANHYITFTIGAPTDFIEGLKEYLGFVETGDNQQLRKFTSTVTVKNHQLYLDTFMKNSPQLAIKRYRRGYKLKTGEMYQFNAFLFNAKENFAFKYEANGKTIECDNLRSGVFQIIRFPGKTLFGADANNYYHLGMVKCFDALKKLAA